MSSRWVGLSHDYLPEENAPQTRHTLKTLPNQPRLPGSVILKLDLSTLMYPLSTQMPPFSIVY